MVLLQPGQLGLVLETGLDSRLLLLLVLGKAMKHFQARLQAPTQGGVLLHDFGQGIEKVLLGLRHN